MKKRILVDLDVITVAEWEREDPRRDIARRFLEKIGEFQLIIPNILLELVSEWKHVELRDKIKSFYLENTDEFVDRMVVVSRIAEVADFEKVFTELLKIDVKEEDIFLILTSSAARCSLVTFNRKHLKDKEAQINQVLTKFGLRKIEVLLLEKSLEFFVFLQYPFTHSLFYLISKFNWVNLFWDQGSLDQKFFLHIFNLNLRVFKALDTLLMLTVISYVISFYLKEVKNGVR